MSSTTTKISLRQCQLALHKAAKSDAKINKTGIGGFSDYDDGKIKPGETYPAGSCCCLLAAIAIGVKSESGDHLRSPAMRQYNLSRDEADALESGFCDWSFYENTVYWILGQKAYQWAVRAGLCSANN